MNDFTKHLLQEGSNVRNALERLNELALDAILFIVDGDGRLLGSLTDGDLRRGFIKGLDLDSNIMNFVQLNPKFIEANSISMTQLVEYRKKNFKILPVIDDFKKVVNVINLRDNRSYLPLDAVLMAGGRGERLRPLTDKIPKPLLPVGDKVIIEYNIDRLASYGIKKIYISIRYLGHLIKDKFGDGQEKKISIKYVEETHPLGTAGSLKLIRGFSHDTILVMNSDLLTNIDIEDLYLFFEQKKADFVVACISYQVNVPYAVMETDEYNVIGFKEKPSYTHFTNAGIYLMKKSVLQHIPEGVHFDATDLMDVLIKEGYKVIAYPIVGYWLDIGKHDDYKKAQEDILHITF